jgi:hypothetical protein
MTTITTELPKEVWIIEKKNGKFDTVFADPSDFQKFSKDWVQITKYMREKT